VNPIEQFQTRLWHPTLRLAIAWLFSCCVAPPALAQWLPSSTEEAIQKANVIVTAQVGKLNAEWIEDERGRHIYTTVELSVLRCLKGEAPPQHFQITVVGGTVGERSEVVRPSYTFEEGEQCVLMFQEGCKELVGWGQAKVCLTGDGVIYGDNLYPSEVFVRAVEVLSNNPNAAPTFKEALERELPNSPKSLRLTTLRDSNPVILSVTPPAASAGTSTLVTIKGRNFLSRQDSGKILFFQETGNPGLSAQVTAWSDTQIVCIVPSGAKCASSGPLFVTNSAGLTSSSFSFKVTFGYLGAKWGGRTPVVTFLINANCSDSALALSAVRRAATTWNGAGAAIRFDYGGTHPRTVASVNYCNEIVWGIPPPGALAVAYYSYYQSTMIEADMVFSASDPWNASIVPDTTKFDLETIALHEFGHYFVLGDLYGDVGDQVYDRSKVMYGAASLQTMKRTPTSSDLEGIRWVYGLPGSQVPAPVISPSGGTGAGITRATIVCSSPEVKIRYTIDGSEPSVNSLPYFEPVTIDSASYVVLKAKGFKDGWVASPTSTAQFGSAQLAHRPQFTVMMKDTAVLQNQPLTFTFRGTDPRSDTLRYSLMNPPAGASMTSSGTFNWKPGYTQAGRYSMTAIVTDGSTSDTARWIITVTKVNLKPVFAARTPSSLVQVIVDKSVTFGVCATDQNGDALTYTWRVNGSTEKAGTDSSFSRLFTGAVGAVQNVSCVFSDPGGLKDSTEWNFTLMADSVIAPPASWSYQAKTGRNCSIGMHEGGHPKIGSQPFRIGDAVGAFFRRNDSLICGGYGLWQTQSIAVTIWGDDDQTATKDGFAEGEDITFRIWDSRAGMEYRVSAYWGPDDPKFSTNSVYTFSSLQGVANRKPSFGSTLGNVTVVQNQTLSFTYTASDPENDRLSFSLINPPAEVTITSSGVFTWKPTIDQIGVHAIAVVVSDGTLADTSRSTVTVTGQAVPASWSYRSSTGKNCTIALGASIDPKIGSQSFRPGDAVGVFYKRNDSLVCGGYAVWLGQNMAITVWGDDGQTSTKDGFAEGEALTFKVWDSKGGKIFNATAQFSQGTSTYVTNALYVLGSFIGSTAVFVEDGNPAMPGSFVLYQNYPNPFNPETSISYQLGESTPVLLEVFDMLGRRVTVLANGVIQPGVHTVRWDASAFPSGVYTYRLQAGTFTQSRRMMLMK
jgi:hypothetical protein